MQLTVTIEGGGLLARYAGNRLAGQLYRGLVGVLLECHREGHLEEVE